MKKRKEAFDFNSLISLVLRYGVTLSVCLIAIGVIATGVISALGHSVPSSVSQLVATNYGRPSLYLSDLFSGLSTLNPVYIIQLGMLVLLATPIVRVAISVALFAAERDRIYVALTLFVLSVLLVSIFVIAPIVS